VLLTQKLVFNSNHCQKTSRNRFVVKCAVGAASSVHQGSNKRIKMRARITTPYLVLLTYLDIPSLAISCNSFRSINIADIRGDKLNKISYLTRAKFIADLYAIPILFSQQVCSFSMPNACIILSNPLNVLGKRLQIHFLMSVLFR